MGFHESIDEDKRSTLRRFAAIGAATPLAKLVEDDSIDDETHVRNAITGYLEATPGAHFSKIRDDLQLGTGETQHHLRRLAEIGVIESHRDGNYRRFYPSDRFAAHEKTALGYLRRQTPRGMLITLLEDPTVTPVALAEELDVSRPTISKYGNEMESVGLLSRTNGYTVKRPEMILVLLIRYADSFGTRAAKLAERGTEYVAYDP